MDQAGCARGGRTTSSAGVHDVVTRPRACLLAALVALLLPNPARVEAQSPYDRVGSAEQAGGPVPWSPGADAAEKLGWIGEAWASGGGFHGVILGAVSGRIVFERAFGHANLELGVPSSVHLRYPAPGLTLQFTAAAVGAMVERGAMSLDAPIGLYVPGLRHDLASIPIRALLGWRSGIDQDVEDLDARPFTRYVELVPRVNELDVLAPPFERPSYSGVVDYVLIAAALEEVTGRPFEDVVEENVFIPVGMRDSGFLDDGRVVPGLVSSYQTVAGATLPHVPERPPSARPNRGGFTTAKDAFRFLRAVLGGDLGSAVREAYVASEGGVRTIGIEGGDQVPSNAVPADRRLRYVGTNAWGNGGTVLTSYLIDWDHGLVVLSNVHSASLVYDIQRRWTRAVLGLQVGLPEPEAKRAVWRALRDSGPDAAASEYDAQVARGRISSLPLTDEIGHSARTALDRGEAALALAVAELWKHVGPESWRGRVAGASALRDLGRCAEADREFERARGSTSDASARRALDRERTVGCDRDARDSLEPSARSTGSDGDRSPGEAPSVPDGAWAQQPYHDYAPTWSPDGERIAFMRRFGPTRVDIFVLDLESGAVTRLTDRAGKDQMPVWSPDGALIAFCSDRDGQDDIFVMAPDGSGVRNLTNHPAGECDVAWSPDGERLAFTSDRNGNNDVFITRLGADAAPIQITRSSGYDLVVGGGWAPDGSLIAFSSGGDAAVDESAPGAYDAFAIYTVEPVPGATPRKVIDLPGEDSYASWSTDGGTILFAHQEPAGRPRDDQYDIYEAAPDGSDARPLIGGPGQQFNQAVSPDGLRVAFHGSDSGRGAIWIADRDGSDRRQLTNLEPATTSSPAGRHVRAPRPLVGPGKVDVRPAGRVGPRDR